MEILARDNLVNEECKWINQSGNSVGKWVLVNIQRYGKDVGI